MSERFVTKADSVASGTDKTAINVFNPAATPTVRGKVYEVIIGPSPAASMSDEAARFVIGRTTAVGTEGSGFTPNNIDPAGPAGAYDSGVGVFSVEPTYTAAKELLVLPVYHRSTVQWAAFEGRELKMAATQNNGAGLKTAASSGTQAYCSTVFFEE